MVFLVVGCPIGQDTNLKWYFLQILELPPLCTLKTDRPCEVEGDSTACERVSAGASAAASEAVASALLRALERSEA